jgi:hypothetical protein
MVSFSLVDEKLFSSTYCLHYKVQKPEDGGIRVLSIVVTTCATIWCCNPEDYNLNFHRYENLKSHRYECVQNRYTWGQFSFITFISLHDHRPENALSRYYMKHKVIYIVYMIISYPPRITKFPSSIFETVQMQLFG